MRAIGVLFTALLVCMGGAQDRISARAQLLHLVPSHMAFQPDGRHLVMMYGYLVAIYDTQQDKVVRLIMPQQLGATSFVGTNGSIIAVTQPSSLALYETNTLRLIRTFDSSLELIQLSPMGNWVALCSRSRTSATVYLVNLYDGRSYSYGYDNLYSSASSATQYPKVCFAPNEQHAVVVVAPQTPASPRAFVIRLADGAVENQFEFGDSYTLPIKLSTSPSGRSMAVYAWHREATTGRLLEVKLLTGTQRVLYSEMPEVEALGLAWLPDETLLFSAGYGIWVVANGVQQNTKILCFLQTASGWSCRSTTLPFVSGGCPCAVRMT